MKDFSKYNINKIKEIIKKELKNHDGNFNPKSMTDAKWEYLIEELIKTYQLLEDKLHQVLVTTVASLEDNILDDFSSKKIDKPLMEFYMRKLAEVKDSQIIIKDILKH